MRMPVTGANRQRMKFDMLSNHLVNSSTVGFKGDILTFDDAMGIQMHNNFKQGELQRTGNELDVALNSNGFFAVETPAGTRYTRNGNFKLSDEGMLLTQSGYPVLGDSGPINIEGNDIKFNENGDVNVDGQIVNRLRVSTFKSPDKLRKEGSNLFAYDGPEGDASEPEWVQMAQGYVEAPNVKMVGEMTNMVETVRIFEAFQKLMQTYDDMAGKVISEAGRI